MTVAELIDFLRTQPQDLQVIYGLYSESVLLKVDDIVIEEACEPRPDGWVPNKRPDRLLRKYLGFPGN